MTQETPNTTAPSLQSTVMLPLSQLAPNEGQIPGLPANPRQIDEIALEKLKVSIQEDPEMMKLRELLVYKQSADLFVVIGGNMRLKALTELGYSEAPCKIIPEDTPVETLRALAIKDNLHSGEWDEGLLQTWDMQELEHWGVSIEQQSESGEDKEQLKAIEFVFTPDEFHFVKKRLRNMAENDREALVLLLSDYES